MSCIGNVEHIHVKILLLDLIDFVCEENAEAYAINIIQEILDKVFPIQKPFVPILHLGRTFVLMSEDYAVSFTRRPYPARSRFKTTILHCVKEFKGNEYSDIFESESHLARGIFGVKCERPPGSKFPQLGFITCFQSIDHRVVPYEFKKIIFHRRSGFQYVKIASSEEYGNVLILDGLVSLAESDLVYVENYARRGMKDYVGKDVLILGGGDGCLLNEIIPDGPNSISMVEIDPTVLQACREHMRKICGSILDHFKFKALKQDDPNQTKYMLFEHENKKYRIIVGDAIQFMRETCKKEARKFDIIFGDLTEAPLSPIIKDNIQDSFKNTIQLIFSTLRPCGIYCTHVSGIFSLANQEMFEDSIQKSVDFPLEFDKFSAFIPSLQEEVIFYRIKEANVLEYNEKQISLDCLPIF